MISQLLYGAGCVTGVCRGLQNLREARAVFGGFDSHTVPPNLTYQGVRLLPYFDNECGKRAFFCKSYRRVTEFIFCDQMHHQIPQPHDLEVMEEHDYTNLR